MADCGTVCVCIKLTVSGYCAKSSEKKKRLLGAIYYNLAQVVGKLQCL